MNITNYELNKYIEIFKKDKAFQSILKANEIALDNNQYTKFVELLLINRARISEFSIDDLVNTTPFFLREEIAEIFEKSFISRELYKNIFYTFKHSSLKKFFSENWKKFFPEYDVLNIESTEQLKLFQKSLMQEFDKFSDVINEMYNIQDVDLVPDEYLGYLAQLIGYEREERELLADSSFRELIKNIIEIYRIKGTNFSFELFFGFLGFEASILEYWFDKRYFNSVDTNPFTGSSDKNNFEFYLTPIKPTDTIPEGIINPYIVMENEIVETLGLNEFNRFISTEEFTLKQLIGEEPGYKETPYTFFKTNIVEFSLSRFTEGSISESQELIEEDEELVNVGEGISEQDLRIIELYARFLTPIFISRRISIILFPFQDEAGIIALEKDEFLHHGKHSLGGYFIEDIYNSIFNPNNPNSVYSILEYEYPELKQEEIYLKISELLSTKELFTEYGIPNIDLLYPFVDMFFEMYSVQLLENELENFSDKNLLIHFNENELVEKMLFFMFADLKFDFSANYSVLEPYPNSEIANGIFKKTFPGDTKGSIFDLLEKPEDFYNLEHKKFVNQFAGTRNTFHRKVQGKAKKFFTFLENNFILLRNSQNKYESSFNKNFLLDYIDILGPSEEQKFLAVELTENEELVNITTGMEDKKLVHITTDEEDEKLFVTEISEISSIW